MGPLRYWFTKVKEWSSHRAPILHTAVSPDGQYIATLANDIKETSYETEPTFRIWEIFEKIEDEIQQDNSQHEICYVEDHIERKVVDKERIPETA